MLHKTAEFDTADGSICENNDEEINQEGGLLCTSCQTEPDNADEIWQALHNEEN